MRASFAEQDQLARLAKYHGNDPQQARWVLGLDRYLALAVLCAMVAGAHAGWLTCPVLALHGDLDEFGTLAHPRMIAGLPCAFAGQGQFQVLAQCGHVPHREQPDQVLVAVKISCCGWASSDAGGSPISFQSYARAHARNQSAGCWRRYACSPSKYIVRKNSARER
jgi:hypothetical protein